MPRVSPRRSVSDTPATAVSTWRVPRTGYSRVRSVATSMRCVVTLIPEPPPSPPACTQHAARLPARSVSGGISPRQRSITYGQRGANGQPAGMLAGSGGEPGICRSRWRSAPLHRRDRRQQAGRVRMLGGGEDRGGRSLLDDVAGVHHEHSLGDTGDDAEVVGDPDHRHRHLLAEPGDEGDDLLLDRHVEGGRRLVGDEHLGAQGQRHGDDDTLAHPAGELVGIRPRGPSGTRDADLGEHLDRAVVGLARATSRGRAAPRRSGRRRASAGSATSSGPGTPSPSRRRVPLGGRPRPSPARRGRPRSTGPATISAGGTGCSPITDSIVSDFPQPDSPTRATVSPAPTSKLTSSTIVTGPPSRCRTVVKPRTERTASFIAARRAGMAVTMAG